jgi:hypothetical protein
MAKRLRILRGLEADIPTLLEGELGFTTDSNKLFVGTSSGNIELGGSGGAGTLQATLDLGNTATAQKLQIDASESGGDTTVLLIGGEKNDGDGWYAQFYISPDGYAQLVSKKTYDASEAKIETSAEEDLVRLQSYNGSNERVELQVGYNDSKFIDSRIVKKGIEYNGDYSAGYTSRSLVDKAYVDNKSLNYHVKYTCMEDILSADTGELGFDYHPVSLAQTLSFSVADIDGDFFTDYLINKTGTLFVQIDDIYGKYLIIKLTNTSYNSTYKCMQGQLSTIIKDTGLTISEGDDIYLTILP